MPFDKGAYDEQMNQFNNAHDVNILKLPYLFTL